jgi:hypothetical protein
MLKQGTTVSFKINDKKYTGKVCGKSTNDMPIIGAIYIIEPDQDISNDVYQYTHCAIPQCLLEVI